MERRDFIINSARGMALLAAVKLMSPFELLAKNKFTENMRIATIEDAQAIVDYWNANLAAIEAEMGQTLEPMELSWLTTPRNYFNKNFIVWDENNVMVCSKVYNGQSIITFCWSSGVSNLKAGLLYCAQESKTRNLNLITGLVKTGSSFAQFLDLYDIPKISERDGFSIYGDTPDNFITKLS